MQPLLFSPTLQHEGGWHNNCFTESLVNAAGFLISRQSAVNGSGRFTYADFILAVVTSPNLVHILPRTCELLRILLSFFVWVNFNMHLVRVEVIETGFWLTDNENTTSPWHSWDKCAVKFYQTRTPLSVHCMLPLFPVVLMETWYPRAIASKRGNLISK